jgi:hypothetical protein
VDTQDKLSSPWHETQMKHLMWFCLRLTVAAIPAAVVAFLAYIVFVFLISLIARAVL